MKDVPKLPLSVPPRLQSGRTKANMEKVQIKRALGANTTMFDLQFFYTVFGIVNRSSFLDDLADGSGKD